MNANGGKTTLADEWEPGAGRGDDKIIGDKIMGPEMWQKYELAGIWGTIWSALGMDQFSDGGDSVPSRPLQSALVWSGCGSS